MEALTRAVAVLLARGGWLVGLIVLETLLLMGFWLSGPTPFGSAFDRRAAEADLLIMTLTSLPALFAGALLSAGDREDGMADFYRSCRVSPWVQVLGSGAGLFVVVGGSLAFSLVVSLALIAPASLLTASPWIGLGVALLSCAVHGAWGLAIGAWVRSRWAAVTGVLLFWILTVFAWEALVTAFLSVLPARWTLSALLSFLALDPAEFIRVVTVFARGQSWTFGPAFAPLRDAFATTPGVLLIGVVGLIHVIVPLYGAVDAWRGKSR